jgi:hypothetical protein
MGQYQHLKAMKTLRTLGFTVLLASFFFKVMHWPGANGLAILGFLFATIGTLVPMVRQGVKPTTHNSLKPLVAVLLYGAGLMHMLTYPGGTMLFHSMVVVAIVYLLSGSVKTPALRA